MARDHTKPTRQRGVWGCGLRLTSACNFRLAPSIAAWILRLLLLQLAQHVMDHLLPSQAWQHEIERRVRRLGYQIKGYSSAPWFVWVDSDIFCMTADWQLPAKLLDLLEDILPTSLDKCGDLDFNRCISHPFQVDIFTFSTQAFPRTASQEEALPTLDWWLCSSVWPLTAFKPDPHWNLDWQSMQLQYAVIVNSKRVCDINQVHKLSSWFVWASWSSKVSIHKLCATFRLLKARVWASRTKQGTQWRIAQKYRGPRVSLLPTAQAAGSWSPQEHQYCILDCLLSACGKTCCFIHWEWNFCLRGFENLDCLRGKRRSNPKWIHAGKKVVTPGTPRLPLWWLSPRPLWIFGASQRPSHRDDVTSLIFFLKGAENIASAHVLLKYR